MQVARHKPYSDFQSLTMPIHWGKDLSIDFIIDVPSLANNKDDSYDLIPGIVNRPTKIFYNEPVKVTIMKK